MLFIEIEYWYFIFCFSYLRLRGTPDVKDEMDDMRVEHEAIKSLPHVSFKDMIVNPALRSPLIIGKMHTLKKYDQFFVATFEEDNSNITPVV